MLLKWFFALYYGFFPSQFTVGPVIYQPYAFVDIQIAPALANFVFDELTTKFRKKAVIDPDYDMNSMIVKTFGADNPSRLFLQYADKSGAKIGLGILKLDGARSIYYNPNSTYVTITLGYNPAGISQKIVSMKLIELLHDAETTCKAAATGCVIKARLVTP
jgi:hypothetical protein